MSTAVFRVDSSSQMGGGHVFRCMTLAKALSNAGWDCYFICKNLEGNLSGVLRKSQINVDLIPVDDDWSSSDDAIYCRRWFSDNKVSPELIVVDHYGLDAKWHDILVGLCAHLLVIDDLANRTYQCDIILDQSIGRESSDYTSLLPENCTRLIGPDFAIIRDEFSRARSQALIKRQSVSSIQRILVAISATDPDNVTLKVLKVLAQSFDLANSPAISGIDVILTSKAPGLELVKDFVENSSIDINLHVDTDNVAQIMLDADLAIAAGGTSLLERHCLGLPSVIICIADNQKHIAEQSLVRKEVFGVITPDLIDAELSDLIVKASNDIPRYRMLALRVADTCDGSGSQKVVEALKYNRNKVWLRKVTAGDSNFLFDLQQQKSVRQYARNEKPPSLDEHEHWLTKTLADLTIDFFVIMFDGESCGYVRIHQRTLDNIDGYEVSIAVSEDYRGKSLASRALGLLHNSFPERILFAWIKNENEASLSLFKKAGYIPLFDQWHVLRNQTK